MMEEKDIILHFRRLTENAFVPVKTTLKAAGFDLKSAYDYIVCKKGKELIETDLKIWLPDGCYGRIAPRSGLAWNNFIDIGAGVIDEDYRGSVRIVVFNHSDTDFEIKRGDRIAQLICERVYYPKLREIAYVNGSMEQIPNDTDRENRGFGSSGIND